MYSTKFLQYRKFTLSRYLSSGSSKKPQTFIDGFHEQETVNLIPYRSLSGTDMDVSALSLGASSLGSVFRNTDLQESIQVVKKSIQKGINLIDTAPWYGFGKSEEILGQALKNIPRSSYYINSKIGRFRLDLEEMFDFSGKRTLSSIQESLDRLKLDQIDVIQIHDPEYCPDPAIIFQETLPALQEAKNKGLVRYIGMTGYPLQLQKSLIKKSKIKFNTSLCYCHYSLNDQTLINFLPFLNENNIGCINASPVSMGLLTNQGPPEWHPATELIKQVCAEAVQFCKKSRVDISRLAMQFSLRNEKIPTTLCSTASLERSLLNIYNCYTSLNEKEEAVLTHLLNEHFIRLKGQESWEGADPDSYFKKLGKIYLARMLYGNEYITGQTLPTKK